MKLTRQREINNIIGECTSFDELNRVTRLIQIYNEELADKLDTIWVCNAKIDKVFKELTDKKYGN